MLSAVLLTVLIALAVPIVIAIVMHFEPARGRVGADLDGPHGHPLPRWVRIGRTRNALGERVYWRHRNGDCLVVVRHSYLQSTDATAFREWNRVPEECVDPIVIRDDELRVYLLKRSERRGY